MPAGIAAPALPVGAAGEHAGFAGTLSIGTDVLAATIVEIVRNAGSEFDRIVVVNAHGGNLDAVRAAAKTCEYEGRPFGGLACSARGRRRPRWRYRNLGDAGD